MFMTVSNSKMINKKFENFIPKNLALFEAIVKKYKSNGRDFSDRTLRYYITVKILPKPMYVKKKAYFDEEFILNELEAIYTLRTLFGMGIAEIAKYSKNPFGTLTDIVCELEGILENKVFTALSKHKDRPLGFRYVNSKLLQFVAQKYFEKINKGWWPSKMKGGKFIDEVFEEYQEKYGQG